MIGNSSFLMRHRTTQIAFFTLILLPMAGLSVAGEVYKWKDAEGRIHYGENARIDVSGTRQIKIQSTSVSSAKEDVKILEPIIRPFDVYGVRLSELKASLSKSGPFDVETQTRRWGMCEWNISWEFTFEIVDNQCRIDKFLLKLEAVIDLPRWRSRDSAPADFRAKWDRFEKALRLHEEGHRSNGIAATKVLAGKLRAMGPQKDCAALKREISSIGARVIAEYELLDETYDRSTDHGVSQGAKFW